MKIRKAVKSVLTDGGKIRRTCWVDGLSLRINKNLNLTFNIDPFLKTSELNAFDLIADDWEVVK